MIDKEAVKELAKALTAEGFDPRDFEILDEGEDPEIPDLYMPSHSLSPEWLERSEKAASRLWPAIVAAANGYPLTDEVLRPIDDALAETGSPDSLVLFALYLLARDATRFTDAVAQAKFSQERAMGGATAKHGSKKERAVKVKKLQAIWLEGNHASRDICAFDMHESVGLAYTAAKNALTKKLVADPDPWPAKEKASNSR